MGFKAPPPPQTERDVSVRQRAADLLYAMCDRSTAQQIVAEMLSYLETADYAIREEIVGPGVSPQKTSRGNPQNTPSDPPKTPEGHPKKKPKGSSPPARPPGDNQPTLQKP